MDVSSHISLAVFPAERRKSSLLQNPLFSLIIQKSVSPHFTTVQNAFNPLLSVALVAIIGHFRCLYWLIKYYHWPNYAASLHLREILGWDLLQRPLPASVPRQGNNFEPPLKTNPWSTLRSPSSRHLCCFCALFCPFCITFLSIKTTRGGNLPSLPVRMSVSFFLR